MGNIFILKSYTDSFTWYRIYSDYWVEQGGYNSPNNTEINFPIKMRDIYYSITNSVEETYDLSGSVGNYYWRWEHVSFRKTSSVTFRDFTDIAIGIHWEIKGYGDIDFINKILN